MSRITNTIGGRFFVTLAALIAFPVAVHIAARVVLNGLIIPTFPYTYRDQPASKSLFDWHPASNMDAMFVHIPGLLLTLVACALLYGLWRLARYVVKGRNRYVDPCSNPRACPCPRHREEERSAEIARLAALTATTAAAATIINS